MSENQEADLYSVLGATSCDTVQHIKHKYQQLVLQYHPDRVRGDSSLEAESALKTFLEIDAAWRILKDKESRRQYDLKLRAQELTQDWPVDSSVCLEDMSWDEDSGMYTYGCRCGGAFAISEEEMKKPDEEEEDGGWWFAVTRVPSVCLSQRRKSPRTDQRADAAVWFSVSDLFLWVG